MTLPLILVLAACKATDDRVATPPFEPPTPAPACIVSLEDTYPSAGDEGVFYRTAVQLEFSESDPSVAVDVDGMAGAGVWLDDRTYEWRPDLPLQPGSTQTLHVSWCDGNASQSSNFTTSDAGSSPVDVDGRVYRVDLGPGRWMQPAGVGALLASQLEDPVVGFEEEDGQLYMLHAMLDGHGQNLCAPTTRVPVDFSGNPFYVSERVPFALSADFDDVTADIAFSGAFVPGGERIEGIALRGLIDIRDSTGDVCNATASFGVDCVPCDDGVVACLDLRADDLTATQVPGLVLQPVTPDDLAMCD